MTDTEKKDRRPDCVTEVRRGNTVLVVSGYFKQGHRRRQDDESAGSGKRSRTKNVLYCLSLGMEKAVMPWSMTAEALG